MMQRHLAALAVAVLIPCVLPGEAAAQGTLPPNNCGQGLLTQIDALRGQDLVVTQRCAVKGKATFKFTNVNVRAGGELVFEDGGDIDFWASNILVENGGSLIAGTEANPFGSHLGTLTIHLWGKDQGVGGRGITCLDERCGVPVDIWDSNVDHGSHKPVPPAQARKISQMPSASEYARNAGGVTDDYFYAYHPLKYDEGDPLGYFGYKVLAVSYGGTLQLFGTQGAAYGNTTQCGEPVSIGGTSWARLSETATAGSKQIKLDRKISVKDGDRVVVTTTDYLTGHSEEIKVSGTVGYACQSTLTLKDALRYDHRGDRFPLTDVPATVINADLRNSGAETRAAVGLLSRTIRIVSAGDGMDDEFPPEPPAHAPYFFGGHVVAAQGFKTFQMQGVELEQLGQGGRISHYPIHFHHARKTPANTFVKDSSIHDSMTRWIVLHGTHGVTLARNVGYKSIGHGFYLEDGTEINNTFEGNLGIFARAAVKNAQNKREVPGILAARELLTSDKDGVAAKSDYEHPTVFWITNGWNDFRDNVAAGASTCGLCYWLVPAYNSTMSRLMKWESYASMQDGKDMAATTPLKSFVGNQCTAAMTAFQTIGETAGCAGVGWPNDGIAILTPVDNTLAPQSKDDLDYFPSVDVGGGRFATRCDGLECGNPKLKCSEGQADACMVTVLDHFTTSFNYAPFNFAAIWLRPQWNLVTDSVITDQLQAGLTMVTGGGYTTADAPTGHWALTRKSVFIGQTQPNNKYAFDGGPFNPVSGLRCAADRTGNRPPNRCVSVDEGMAVQMSNFGMYQRLYSVYDGPAYQESNAYLNIKRRTLDDCDPFLHTGDNVGRCDPADLSVNRYSAWIAGAVAGLPKAPPDAAHPKGSCYMPNAAIGWKQPNGFYYPPAFHSANLYFSGVDIRHFVVSPPFVEGKLDIDWPTVQAEYCNFSGNGSHTFKGFAGNDRQTVLNDADGSLTGFIGTTVINLDPFFAAPVDAIQCRSDESSRTSPYEYVTTVLYPKCRIDGSCAGVNGAGDPIPNDGGWNRSCTSESCYGVPLWRQDEMPKADGGIPRSIRMMGQNTSQRGSLTVNRGTYYIDTSVDEATQLQCATAPCVVNVFKKSDTYYTFLLYATQNTRQTYRFWVGPVAADNTLANDPVSYLNLKLVRASLTKEPASFTLVPTPSPTVRWLGGDKTTGIVEVDLKVADVVTDWDAKLKVAKKEKCQPKSFCTWVEGAAKDPGMCVGKDGKDDICKWAVVEPLDCPEGGCVGFVFTLPDKFQTAKPGSANAPRPPPAKCVPKGPDSPFNATFRTAQQSVAGECNLPPTQPLDFCSSAVVVSPNGGDEGPRDARK